MVVLSTFLLECVNLLSLDECRINLVFHFRLTKLFYPLEIVLLYFFAQPQEREPISWVQREVPRLWVTSIVLQDIVEVPSQCSVHECDGEDAVRGFYYRVNMVVVSCNERSCLSSVDVFELERPLSFHPVESRHVELSTGHTRDICEYFTKLEARNQIERVCCDIHPKFFLGVKEDLFQDCWL